MQEVNNTDISVLIAPAGKGESLITQNIAQLELLKAFVKNADQFKDLQWDKPAPQHIEDFFKSYGFEDEGCDPEEADIAFTKHIGDGKRVLFSFKDGECMYEYVHLKSSAISGLVKTCIYTKDENIFFNFLASNNIDILN